MSAGFRTALCCDSATGPATPARGALPDASAITALGAAGHGRAP